MAAGAYKGLTIRIGADLTKFTTALRGADSAIYKTQAEMNKLSKATKLDPANLSVAAKHVGVLSEQTYLAATRMGMLQQGFSALASTNLKGTSGTVADLARNTDSVALSAINAKNKFNEATAALGTTFRELAKYTKDKTFRNFDEQTEMSTIESELNKMEKANKLTSVQVDEYKNKIKELKDEWKAARNEYDNYQSAADLSNMETKLAEQEASLNAFLRSLAKVDKYTSFKDLGTQLESVNQQLTLVNAAVEVTSSRFSKIDAAFRLDPSNIDTAAARSQSLSDALMTAEMKADLLKQKIDAYGDTGIADMAKNMGNVSLEAELAEKAFHQASRKLEEWRQTGDTTSDEFHQLENAVEQARQRMDTAHACQQYHNLQTELSETSSTAVDLAKKLADITAPSSVATSSSVSRLKDELGLVSGALGRVVSDADTFNSALKLNPDSLGVARQQAELLSEALRLATDEGENLKQQYQTYDLTAIREAADYTKSAEQQIAEAGTAYDNAAEAVRRLNKEIIETKAAQDAANAAGNIQEYDRLGDKLKELEKNLSELSAREAEAGRQFDLSKQRQEVRDLETDMAKNTATTEKLTATINKLSQTKATPVFDISAVDRMESAIEEMARTSFGNGFVSIANQIKDVDEAIKDAKAQADMFKGALKIDPTNIGYGESKTRALGKAIELSETKVSLLKKELSAIPYDRVDRLAIASGTVSSKVSEATRRFDEAKSKIQGYESVIKELEKSIAEIQNKDLISNEDKARLEDMNSMLTTMTRLLGEAKQEGDAATDALADAKVTQTWQSITNEIIKTQSETKKYENELDGVSDKTDKAKKSTDDWTTAAVAVASKVADAMKRAASEIVNTSVQIDSAYRDMRKTVEGTEEQYQELYDAAMKYSQTHVTSADTMLEMEALAGQVGVTAENLQHFAEVAANLDVATNIDSETIALQMGQIANVMSDLDHSNVEKFADALVRLGNNMPTQESNIMQITQRLSAIGDVAHFSTPELLGWAAAIASTGQKSEAAASGIATTITNISRAISAGDSGLAEYAKKAGVTVEQLTKEVETGGDKLSDYAKAAGTSKRELSEAVAQVQKLGKYAELAGYSTEELAEKWRTDPSETLKRIVTSLKDSGDEVFATLSDLDINGVRQTQTLAALAQTVDTVTKSVGMAESAFNGLDDEFGAAGDAEREATRKAEGVSGSMAKLENSMQVLKATLGDALVPIINAAAKAVQLFSELLSSLPSGAKTAIVTIGGLVGAIGAIVPMASAFSRGWKKAFESEKGIAVMKAFKSGVTGLKTALSGLVTTGAFIPGVFGAIATAVGIEYAKHFVNAARETKRFNDVMSDIGKTTDNISTDFLLGTKSLDTYGGSWKDLRVDMDDFLSSLEEHNQKNRETRESTSEQIGMLEHYRQVVEDAAGKGDEFTGSQLELKTAVDGLNEILGTNYDVTEILAGVYKDEAGQIHQVASEVNNLVEAKKRELRISAMEDIYKEAVKAQAEAENAYKKSEQAYNEYLENFRENNLGKVWHDVNSGADITIDDSNWRFYAEGTLEARELRQAQEELGIAVRETGEEVALAEKQWEGYENEAEYLKSTQFGIREGIIMNSEAMRDALMATTDWGSSIEEINPEVKELASKLQEAKVGTQEFADLARENPDVFREMCANAAGDMDALVAEIQAYNKEHLEEKYAIVEWDPDGQWFKTEDAMYVWDTYQWRRADLEVDATQVDEIPDRAKRAAEEADAEVEVTADTDDLTEQIVDAAVEGAESASTEATVTADIELDTANTSSADVEQLLGLDGDVVSITVNITANTSGAGEVVEALNQLPETKGVKIEVDAPNIKKKADNIVALNKAAKDMDSAKKTYTANGNAVKAAAHENVEKLNSAASKMESREIKLNATGNIANGVAASNTWSLINALKQLPREKTTTITTNQVTRKSTVTVPSGAGSSATGAYVPYDRMPRHAAGIFTRPTLTNIGWVGEDGAELYSGNSLVPLTNRKYSMPYINDISDAVARKLDGAGSSTVINLSVTCDGGPNETADAIVRALRLNAF